MRSLIVLVSTLALAACNMAADAQNDPGDGRVSQRSFNVGTFEGVALGGSHDVVVSVGGPASVRAEGDAEIIDKLDIRVEDGTLKIGTKKGVNWSSGFMRNRAPVTVYVTAPRLAAAAVAGSGDMRIDRIEGDRFKASVAGSGDLHVAEVRVSQAEFSVAGSGDISAAGSASNLSAAVKGSGDVKLAGLNSRQATVSVMGSGDVHARASETATVSVMGSGNVTLDGGAKCSVSTRGSGEVRCGS